LAESEGKVAVMKGSINPATGEELPAHPETSEAEIQRILERADKVFREWRRTPCATRSERFKKAGAVLRARRIEFGDLMAREMGKPVTQGRAEIDKCALTCDYYAEHGARFLESGVVPTDARKSFIAYEPLGVVLAIMPWNFPFWQVFRAAIPALMAGNAMVLKHASNVFGCALAMESVFREAEFPHHLFSSLLIGSRQVPPLIADSRIKGVTLTGSTEAGRSVAEAAGRAIKKTVLELGGSDPYVVLEDADLEQAVETCVNSRLINAGQSCIAAKRFIVVESVRRKFEDAFVEKMRQRQPGDPMKETTTLGPLARFDLRDSLHQQVERTVKEGAKLAVGGKIPNERGAFYPPTVLLNVTQEMTAFREETFGPVAAIVGVPDEKRAIELANDSPFGLGAAIFTCDLERGERIAIRELDAGCCFVNDSVRSDPRLPFGGIKESGYGRELGMLGIREFVNIKTVYVR
jgi:succinate-semialdehyde dehydrogenase/glutarate-semialdehyde dehydrogenase